MPRAKSLRQDNMYGCPSLISERAYVNMDLEFMITHIVVLNFKPEKV